MKKKISSFIIMLTLIGNIITISASADSTWKHSYMNFLLNKTFQEDEGIPTISFTDLDFDGIPELLYYDGGMLFGMGQRNSDVYSINSSGEVYKKGTVFSGATSESQAFLDKNTNQKKRLNFCGTSQVIYLMEMNCGEDSTAILSITRPYFTDDNMYHWYKNGEEVHKSKEAPPTYGPTYEDVQKILNYEILNEVVVEEEWKNSYSQSKKRDIINEMLSNFQNDSIKVLLNGTELTFDQPPIMDPEGRVLVPIRKIAESMGADVEWNQSILTAFVNHIDRALIVPLYEDKIYIANGSGFAHRPYTWNTYPLDVPSQEKNGRTLTPVRAFCESLGATVDWDNENLTVKIKYDFNPRYSALTQDEIKSVNMAYSIIKNREGISFDKYSEGISAFLDSRNIFLDNFAMYYGDGFISPYVRLFTDEASTKGITRVTIAEIIKEWAKQESYDDEWEEVINGISLTKGQMEVYSRIATLPEDVLKIEKIEDLEKLSDSVPQLKALAKHAEVLEYLAMGAEEVAYVLSDYSANVKYIDNFEQYLKDAEIEDDVIYTALAELRDEYTKKWIHGLKKLGAVGVEKILSGAADAATGGVFSVITFAQDVTNAVTGLSKVSEGLYEFYAICGVSEAVDLAYLRTMNDIEDRHFKYNNMKGLFDLQKATKITAYRSMNKIANGVDSVSWDDEIYEIENMTYMMW